MLRSGKVPLDMLWLAMIWSDAVRWAEVCTGRVPFGMVRSLRLGKPGRSILVRSGVLGAAS